MQRSFILGLGLGLSLVAGTLTACGSDSGGSSAASYCSRIQAYKDKSDTFDAIFDGDEPPAKADMEKAFTTMQTMVKDLKKGAPEEIKSDVALVSGGVDELVTLFEKYDWDIVALVSSPDADAMQATFDSAELQTAQENLDEYSLKECGIKTES
jgi:hypothetical protein